MRAQNSKMRAGSPRQRPGKRLGSGSSPTHSIESLRRCALCSISRKVMAGDCREPPPCTRTKVPAWTKTEQPDAEGAEESAEFAEKDGDQSLFSASSAQP